MLSLPDLPERLTGLFEFLRGNDLLCVVGGGSAANVVRAWDQIHGLGEESSHRLAIESMRLTTRLVARLLPDVEVVETRAAVSGCWSRQRIALIDPPEMVALLECEAASDLPHEWNATSDTIAAWIAREWPAERLVLVKSVDAPASRAELATSDAVDSCFCAMLPPQIDLQWCGLSREVSLTPIA